MLLRLVVMSVATPTAAAGKGLPGFRTGPIWSRAPYSYNNDKKAVVFRPYFSVQLLAYVIKLTEIGDKKWYTRTLCTEYWMMIIYQLTF